MAQLPPKIPNNQNWPPAFSPHNKMPPLSPPLPPQSSATPGSAWVDEFLNFTSTRRGTHRRSMSDSIAFLELSGDGAAGFERLDDEQLLSMFSDDFSGAAMVGLPSSPSSERDSHNEDKMVPKREPAEVDSAFDTDELIPSDSNADQNGTGVDPKRVKRILANRQSAQRSRVRKLQYISDLERSVTALQTEVSTLSPRVAFLDHQRLILNVDNSALKQRIAALAQDKIFKDAHQEALKKEIERLRQIYHQQEQQQQQNMKKMSINNNSTITAIPSPSSAHTIDKEQLMT